MNPTSEIFGWAILVATFLGPVAAVLVSWVNDRRRELRQRRLWIFRVLMAHRFPGAHPDRTVALNLVQIDFAGRRRVLTAQSNYLRQLNAPIPQENTDRFLRDREHLLTLLLYEMAKVLRIEIEQLEILEGTYYPQGAVDLEMAQRGVLRLFSEIEAGRRALPITVADPPAALPQRDQA